MSLKMCQLHLRQTKEAIRVRGLGHLVPKDAVEFIKKLEATARGDKPLSHTYDPLLALNLGICNAVVGIFGPGIVTGERSMCPLCEVEFKDGDNEQSLKIINNIADEVQDYCQRQHIQG